MNPSRIKSRKSAFSTRDSQAIAAPDEGADVGDLYEDSSLASLRSSILEHQVENGRTYHSMSAGKYNFPNDEVRDADFQHRLWLMSSDEELALAPGHKTAKRVLDVGTGTGIWAIDFADAFPDAEVVGVDLSPIQPDWAPPNCFFEIDDLEKPWTWSRPFDYIHCRSMEACFEDPKKFLKRAYKALSPGGWLEVCALVFPLGCDDGTVPEDAPIRKWQDLLVEAAEKMGRSMEALEHQASDKKAMGEIGFTNMTSQDFIWPLNSWPKDEKLKEIGRWQFVNLDTGLEGLSMGLLTRVLGWTKEEVQVLCANVRKDLKNKSMHSYWRIRVICAQKPENVEEAAPSSQLTPGKSNAASPAPEFGIPDLRSRARKVKCDEAKPRCMRCTSSGRQCAGYEPTIEHGLAWYRPQQLTAHDQREGRAFQFFSHMVGPVLSGPTDSYFWTHLVVQFSHFEPAVRHAVLAISSLYEDFHGGQRVTRQKEGNAFAIRHYSAAIERIKGAQDEQLVLLVCILFVCVEYLQGDVEAALRHCKHGILILNKVGCSSWARQYLMPIFRRLSFISFFLGAKPSDDALVPGLIGYHDPMPPRFASVDEAQNAIDDITVHAIELVAKGDDTGTQPLETRLQEFYGKICELDATIPPQESSKKIAICGMKMKTEMARIQVNTIHGEGEMRFDEWAESFRTIVRLARRAADLKAAFPDERPRASFTFEQGFLSMLGFVSIKCRDLQTRLEALELMAKIPAPKEGLLDVGTLYRVGRREAEIEHGVSLDDGTLERNQAAMAELSFPPEEKRLLGAPIEHELDVIKNEDGTTMYRRTVHFVSKDAEGKVKKQTEYLLDRKPGQLLAPDVPCMRCSKPLLEFA
ncbi:C6 zinc finger domain protein [Colletotrichum karsti]|uniref:C6 zinc finger domain protein n=1 Tax=Colletotrichum karsti TaxID=1095194 RepID=A0A9P6HYZ1_9PEZI|nr:C6 zinc finger domain protein [Colletotrichum karsti]KAF9873169.1 C6 zinc finger domain protein [Colletotrichum karsti]